MAADLGEQLDRLRIDRSEAPRAAPAGRGRLAAVALAVLAVAAAAVVLLLRARPAEVATVRVEAAGGGGGPAAVLNASGYVTARRQATVSSKVTGKVEEVLVEEGMRVEAGQVLARLDDRQAELALGLAEARLDAARKAVGETEALLREARLREERTRRLVADGVVSAAERDAVEAEAGALAARIEAQRGEVRAAEREVALARQALDDTVIRAPFSGVAISKNAQPGEIISPMSAGGGFTRTGISTVVDMESLEVEVDVNEAYIQRVAPGQEVVATLDAYPDAPFPAQVITTIPAADRQKATVTVRIAFARLDPRILPDMGVKVAFLAEAGAAGESAARPMVRVPRAALRGSAGAESVFVVDSEGRLERRAIRLAAGGRDPVEVVAGLAAGERVVVAGPADLAPGERVVERGAN
jgi:RND family efflux transporter MFP subunit